MGTGGVEPPVSARLKSSGRMKDPELAYSTRERPAGAWALGTTFLPLGVCHLLAGSPGGLRDGFPKLKSLPAGPAWLGQPAQLSGLWGVAPTARCGAGVRLPGRGGQSSALAAIGDP